MKINKTAKELTEEFYKEQELKQIQHDIAFPTYSKEKEDRLAFWGTFFMGGILGLVIGLILGSM